MDRQGCSADSLVLRLPLVRKMERNLPSMRWEGIVCLPLGRSVGLSLMRSDDKVFACHRDRWDAIWHGEVGSSAAILDAGMNIDCLMIRWRETRI